MRKATTMNIRAIIVASFILACVLPSILRIDAVPFCTYPMFVDESLREFYYLPIAEIDDGSEYLIRKTSELFPYRLTFHTAFRRLDLQSKIQSLIEENRTGELIEIQQQWCSRVPGCIGVTIFRYDNLFVNGKMTPSGKRVSISSWQGRK